ncbi:MAG: hypothetical protein ABR540_18330 [Acidimicrobiales bacterium]
MAGDLNQEQIALVLRRAAELDRETACPPGTGLDEISLEHAAVEAGISPLSVRRALAELRAGVLDRPEGRRRQWLGAATLTICRVVPGPASAVEEQLHQFLRRELFEVKRDFGDRTSWTQRKGLDARVRRSVDRGIARRLILREVQNVDLSVVEEPRSGGQRILVRLDVDVRAAQKAQGAVSATAAGTGLAVTLLGVAALGPDPGLIFTTAAGAGFAGVGHRVGATVYRHRTEDVESAVDGVLDRLERPALRRPR